MKQLLCLSVCCATSLKASEMSGELLSGASLLMALEQGLRTLQVAAPQKATQCPPFKPEGMRYPSLKELAAGDTARYREIMGHLDKIWLKIFEIDGNVGKLHEIACSYLGTKPSQAKQRDEVLFYWPEYLKERPFSEGSGVTRQLPDLHDRSRPGNKTYYACLCRKFLNDPVTNPTEADKKAFESGNPSDDLLLRLRVWYNTLDEETLRRYTKECKPGDS